MIEWITFYLSLPSFWFLSLVIAALILYILINFSFKKSEKMQNQNLPQTLDLTSKDLPLILHSLQREKDYCEKRRQECKFLGSDQESINYWNNQFKQCMDIINRLSIDI